MKNYTGKEAKEILKLEVILGIILCSLIFFIIIIFSIGIENGKLTPLNGYIGIGISILCFIVSMLFLLKIEQKAGFYKCKICGKKYIPSYKQVTFSMHIGRTRYMKCPDCHQKSWQKKVIE